MKVFSVSQINKIIKDLIDNEIVLEDITVTGELSSFSITRGIAYFTLKDNDNILNCIQFGAKVDYNIGDLVECRGNIKYYPIGGKLSFNVLKIEHCGQGELYKQFLELKSKLEKDGLFDASNKIPLPRFINSIGVVTSKKGAVLQDIKNITERRNPNLDIFVYDAQMQGKYAVQDIIEGISYFDNMTDVDVIIVARGGGSIEDLMPFNDEELAQIAYICNKPIISAVGHETDFTILDFVCDLRAPTPSAAAELVTFDRLELKRYIYELIYSIDNSVCNTYNQLDTDLKLNLSNIERSTNDFINDEILHINSLINNIDNKLDYKLSGTIHSVDMLINTLDRLNPISILKRGYACVTKDNLPVSSNLKIGDEVNIKTYKDSYKAKITEKEHL